MIKPLLVLAALWTGVALSMAARAEDSPQPTIAIIIDDMGNQYEPGLALVELPYPLTLSFLPQRPYTQQLSQLAHEAGKEIMLHAPMETARGLGLGYGALTSGMSEQEIKRTLMRTLNDIPYVMGVNNHMGSHLTQQTQVMAWLMEVLREYPYYFVDSRTSAQTVAQRVALEHRIPSLSRDVFLDHEQNWEFVDQQFKRLLDIAHKQGTAIAIGHPHEVTIRYLREALPQLDEAGIRIATVSALWHIRHPGQIMFADRNAGQRLAERQPSYSDSNPKHQSPN